MHEHRTNSQSSDTDAVSPTGGEHVPRRLRVALAAAALLAMTLASYAPALNAGFIWNDHENVVDNQALVSRDGLRQIWLVPRSIQEYHPLTFTSFWFEHRLWGSAAWGYHLTNILLHCAAAILAWRLLARLQVPGAWLAAALFAIHPVEVESVAWITERKNVLSLSLGLLAMLCYLRFLPAETEDCIGQTPGAARWRWYAMSFALFVLALSANTVVVTMPAVMLVIYWWKRGRITRNDLACMLPFLALSVALGLVTVWTATYQRDTPGKDWSLPAIEQLLLAGRALWFYGGKLLWPYPLVFFYPRWTVDDQVWWQYLWPAAAVAVLVALWFARGRLGRGPFAAVLIFAGVLAPMLGFFNIYYTTYAYVSDHFQYHASLALVALAAAAVALAVARLNPAARAMAYVLGGLLLLGFGSMTYRQTLIYHDLETLYRDTIEKNPQDTFANSNLAVYLSAQGNHEEAISLTRTVLRLDPNDPIAHINLGCFLLNLGSRDGFQPGQLEETVDNLRQGIALAHAAWGAALNEARLRNYLGYCLLQIQFSTGFQPQLLDEALVHLNEATRLDPTYVDAHVNFALALAAADRAGDAIQHAALALDLDPQGVDRFFDEFGPDLLAEAYCAQAGAQASKGDFAAAVKLYQAAVDLRPDHDRAMNNLGVALMNLGKTDEAIRWFQEAVRGDPKYTEAKMNLEKARQVQNNQSAPE